MPQQLLITLPSEASSWVKLNHLEKAKEGPLLWEDMRKMCEGEGENRLMRVGEGVVHWGQIRRSVWACAWFGGQGIFVKEMLGSHL